MTGSDGATAPRSISRRAVLLGAAGVAGAALVAACGGDGGSDAGRGADTGDTGGTGGTATGTEHSLVRFFGDDVVVAGQAQRLTFGLGDADGVVTADAPDTLQLQFVQLEGSSGGEPVGEPVAVRRGQGSLPRPYFAASFTAPAPGTYAAVTDFGGEQVSAAFQVVPQTAVPQVGQAMIAVDTPTTSDPRGVQPICTETPPCPLHDVTLREALAAGQPVALLVSTPRFCQVQICGPVLDVLVGQRERFGGVRMLHAEVFTDEQADTTTETVRAYGLTFEPCLFVADASGRIVARLDNIFDEAELAGTLEAATA